MSLKSLWLCVALLAWAALPVGADHVSPEEIVPDVPRDEIPPLDAPAYEPAPAVDWLEADDWLLVYERAGDARAYPVKIMNWHEIVNDTVGGLPVAVTYCPLCRSGLAFDRRLNQAELSPEAEGVLPEDTVIEFGNTGALYENDMVMYDRQSESEWFQVGGEAITGPLHGTRLKRLPSQMMRWAQFREAFPAGQVLSRETGHGATRNYNLDIFSGYNERDESIPFPVSRRDERLPLKAPVVGVTFGGEAVGYDLESLADGAYADQVGGQPLVLFVLDGAGAAFDPAVEGRKLSFELEDGRFRDAQTGSSWDLSGQAVAGELEGKQLRRLPQSSLFWFSWATLHPESEAVSQAGALTPYAPDAWGGNGTLVWIATLAGVALLAAAAWYVQRRARPASAQG